MLFMPKNPLGGLLKLEIELLPTLFLVHNYIKPFKQSCHLFVIGYSVFKWSSGNVVRALKTLYV